MIGLDSDESKYYEPKPEWKCIPELEKWTGADWIISPKTFPFKTESLIAKHLEAGAILCQRKEGYDLTSSITDGRLLDAICRMNEFSQRNKVRMKPCQKVLLPIGTYVGHQDGSLTVSNRENNSGLKYNNLIGAAEYWTERGGVIAFPITNNSFFHWWLEMKERHLIEIAAHPVKEFIQPPMDMMELSDDAPLQVPIKVKDGRRVLRVTNGEQITNSLWDLSGNNLIESIMLMTSYDTLKLKEKPMGVGKGTIDKNRRIYGIPDGLNVELTGGDNAEPD